MACNGEVCPLLIAPLGNDEQRLVSVGDESVDGCLRVSEDLPGEILVEQQPHAEARRRSRTAANSNAALM